MSHVRSPFKLRVPKASELALRGDGGGGEVSGQGQEGEGGGEKGGRGRAGKASCDRLPAAAGANRSQVVTC